MIFRGLILTINISISFFSVPTTTPKAVCADGSDYTYLGEAEKSLFSTILNNDKNSQTFLDLIDQGSRVTLPAMNSSVLGLFLNDDESDLMEFSFEMTNVDSLTYTIALSNITQLTFEVSLQRLFASYE